uniref:Uncharacterized protein n=1 Tax=Acrobeloides nanus TaxID=290746 RepID=A0A914D792_9BILA
MENVQRLEACATSSTSVCYIVEKPDSTMAISFPAEDYSK